MRLEFVCENDNIRLTEELKNHVSRKLYKHIKGYGGQILLNGVETKTYVMINKGDLITVIYEYENEVDWPLYEGKLNIIYENENYIILNKNPDLLSIPTKSCPKSVFQEVCYYLKQKNEPTNVSILNRLDKGTSGLMMIAKNPYFANLMNPVHEKMERRYLALCHGIFENKEGQITGNIKRSDDSNKRIIAIDGDYALTNYKVVKEYNDLSLVEFKLETGRTHQIRLHSESIGHPLCGDDMYGYSDGFNRLMLHSYKLEFIDPITKELMKFEIGDDFNLEF